MNRRKKFLLSGILLTLVALSVRGVSIAFNSYLTRAVGAEGIGLFTLIMNLYSFAVTFATSGISLTVTRLAAEAVGRGAVRERRRIVAFSSAYALAFSVTAALLLLLLAPTLSARVVCDSRALAPLRVLALSLPPLSLSAVLGGYFLGVKRVVRSSFVSVLCQFFKVAITLSLILSSRDGEIAKTVLYLSISITLTEVFAYIISVFAYLPELKAREEYEGRRVGLGSVCAMALPLALSAYARSALLTIEHALIPRGLVLRGESVGEALASYGILHGMALPTLTYPMAVLTSFAGLLVPEFAESAALGERDRMRRLAGEALECTLVYATVSAVFVFVFAEELGYLLYDSYYAGRYISFMAVVIPIMYLDHVADSMLKGIGEQVYSMTVNILDALLSVLLVAILIPIMGILGYALVIICMEGFNFLLSITRLRRRIRFRVNILRAFVIPLASALFAAFLSTSLFIFLGKGATVSLTLTKLIFALCAFFLFFTLSKRLKIAENIEAIITKKRQRDLS